ncbi:DUF4383 domain-containing protein [Blastococcus sp. SYSU DS0753]
MTRRSDPQRSTTTSPSPADRRAVRNRVLMVHRVGAGVVGVVLLVFAVLGFARGLPFFSTTGESVVGMSTNGLLSTVSVIVGLVLIGGALAGARVASTVMIAVGVLFLVSALGNLAVLRTDFNVFAFDFSNVVFSAVVGLVLLLLGAYGRISGNLPAESPYRSPERPGDESSPVEETPQTPAESAAEEAMHEAERAVAQGNATDEQRRRVEAMSQARSRKDRRRAWMEFDSGAR